VTAFPLDQPRRLPTILAARAATIAARLLLRNAGPDQFGLRPLKINVRPTAPLVKGASHRMQEGHGFNSILVQLRAAEW